MKKIFLTILLFTSITAFSQVKITGYFDAEIGLSFGLSEKISTEIRINDDLGKEFSASAQLQYQFVSKENYNLNFGIGVVTYPFSNNTNTVESFYFPLNIEITPLKEVKNFALVLESAYHLAKNNVTSGIRNSIGIRYIFN